MAHVGHTFVITTMPLHRSIKFSVASCASYKLLGPREAISSNVQSPMVSKSKNFHDVLSPLDPADARPGVLSSEFCGLCNLITLAGVLYVYTTLFTNLLEWKESADLKFLPPVFYSVQLLEVLATFVCQSLYAHTALTLIYMVSTDKLSNRLAINIVHHTLQFTFFSTIIVWRDWKRIRAVSVFIKGLLLLMKMHFISAPSTKKKQMLRTSPCTQFRASSGYAKHTTLKFFLPSL